MKSKNKILKLIKSMGAKVSPFPTDEVWVDKKGNLYNIDRAPIDWKLNAKATTEEAKK